MSAKAKWIWNKGDYELYHYMLLSCRRQEFGCDYPCLWPLTRPSVSGAFKKTVTFPADTSFCVVTHSSRGMLWIDDRKCPVNEEIAVKAGTYSLVVVLYDMEKFPAFYIDSDYLITDESWTSDSGRTFVDIPAACDPAFYGPEADPSVFPFAYDRLTPASVTATAGGLLYDFGRELFGPVTVGGLAAGDAVSLTYGESAQEALDYENAVIRETLTGDFDHRRPARAFRYIFVRSASGEPVDITAEYEYLPLTDVASFTCDDPQIAEIWKLCSHTFHLNSREFYLDGIKRDRWVWSGDAYQSYMINWYLYFDPAIVRRTITALLGRPPYTIHVNTINDYSAYLIMAVYDYYFATGDAAFVRDVWQNLKSLYAFITSRLSVDGYVIKYDAVDWIFIDWGEVDKDGTLSAEQFLLWQVYRRMARLAVLMGEPDEYTARADALRKNICRDFWDADRRAFIDCFDTGKNQISRQSNVLAILVGFVEGDEVLALVDSVLKNDAIPAITTPYFKLYELMVMCKLGLVEDMQRYLTAYWGGMLALDATSVWETFDPTQSGDGHLAMYGMKYGKSLCHAWGSGPIYLLGRYCAGVYATDVAYKTFAVEPNPGIYKAFTATVPVKDGRVTVDYSETAVSVTATVGGGTLILGDKRYDLPANETVTVQRG